MRVLVACEESQRVASAFRAKGHEAYSCDIQPCSGNHPEYHILGDALKLLETPCYFHTCDFQLHQVEKWDLLIAHPPCTYLSNVATRYHSLKCTSLEKINERTMKRIDAMRLFMAFVNAPCDKIAIENPRGVMNTAYRKPDQTIDPYMFAEDESDSENWVTKATCLWLKGLPLLQHKDDADETPGANSLTVNTIMRPDNEKIYGRTIGGKVKCWCDSSVRKSKDRSKTFEGIAAAMAEQWG